MSQAKKDHWLPEVLTSLAVASGVGYLAAAYTISRWLTRSAPGRVVRTPDEYGYSWEPLECRTADAFRLKGWAVCPPLPRATVVLFHGMRQSRQQTLERMALLVSAGYRCVAFDHRAHGESAGKRSSFGYHESRDVVAILDFVRRRWPREPHAAVGISMGGAALCFAAAEARSLAAIVLESVYLDIGTAFFSRIGSLYPKWFKRLSHGVVWVTEKRLGLRLEQLAPVNHIADLAPAPVMLLSGADDPSATPEDTEKLYDRLQGPRELYLVPHAGHKNLFETAGPHYRQRVLGFLDRWVA